MYIDKNNDLDEDQDLDLSQGQECYYNNILNFN